MDLDRRSLSGDVRQRHTCCHKQKTLEQICTVQSDDRVYYPHRCFVTSLLITSGRVVLCFFFLCHAASADQAVVPKVRFKYFQGSVRLCQKPSIYFRDSLIFRLHMNCLHCYVPPRVKAVMHLESLAHSGSDLIGFCLMCILLDIFIISLRPLVHCLPDQALAMVAE